MGIDGYVAGAAFGDTLGLVPPTKRYAASEIGSNVDRDHEYHLFLVLKPAKIANRLRSLSSRCDLLGVPFV